MEKGWSAIDNMKAEIPGQDLNDGEIALAQVFKGDKGRKALEYLRSLTVDRPSLAGMYPDGVNTAIAMGVREGENNLYRRILTTIKKVDNVGSRKQ